MASLPYEVYFTVKEFKIFMQYNADSFCNDKFDKYFSLWFKKRYSSVWAFAFNELITDVSEMTINESFSLSVLAFNEFLKNHKSLLVHSSNYNKIHLDVNAKLIDGMLFTDAIKDIFFEDSNALNSFGYFSYISYKKAIFFHYVKKIKNKELTLIESERLNNKFYYK